MNRIIFVLIIAAVGCKGISDVTYTPVEEVVIMDPIEVTPERKVYNPSDIKVNDLLHTRLEVSFDWGKQYLHGKARLDFKPYFYPTDRLILDAKGFDIHKVELVTDSTNTSLKYTYDDWYLDIDLGRKYSRFEKYSIYIEYTAKPNELPIGGSAAIVSDKGLYFINPDSSEVGKPTQIWTQGETEASSCWFPTIDSPNERMTQEIFINVDDRYKTLSNGELIYSNYNADGTRTDYWQQTLSHPPYLVMMAVGDFVIAMDTWENKAGDVIPVNYYMEQEYAPYAYDIFGNTPEMLTFFSDLLNYDYPWTKFSQIIVRDYVSGAMENTTAVIHGDFLNATAREMLDGDNEDVISHELFHHWFGDLVTCESWANLPLNESFATYGEYLWNEYKYGREEADHAGLSSMRGYMRESRTKKVPIIRYDYDDKDDMFDAHSYNKGGRILHMLRSLLGDEAFFESLNKYLTNNEYSDAEAHSLRLACEQVTGLDLNWFFNQWFFEAGHPELDIRYEYVDSLREQRIIVEQTQDLSSSILFKFPVKVDMYASGDLTSQEYFIEERIDTLKISSSSKPSFVNFDVEKVLLCSKNDVKPDSWWERQYESAAHYVARYDALARATEEGAVIPSIIVDALNDASWHMREMALEAVPLLDSAKLTSLENQVVTMTKDERSNVRATALIALAIEFDGSKHKKLFIDGLNDRSYMVIAYSLQALSMVDYQQASKEAKALELEESSEIIYAISEMYAENGDQSKNQFFVDKIAIASPDDRYSLVQNYAVFLSNQETSMMADNLGTIVEIARNGEPWWIKYSAYQGFMILLGDVDAQKEQIEAELSEMEVPDIQLQNVLDNLASRRNIIQTTFEDCIATETDRRILNSFGGATE